MSQAAPGTPFEWIGGEDKVKALVERFYDLMELEPKYAELRAAHGPDLSAALTAAPRARVTASSVACSCCR